MHEGHIQIFCLIIALFTVAAIIPPASAATRIYPTYEWQTFAGTEQQPLANAFDGNLATYAQWGTSYNQGMIKLTFPAGTNLTEMRYYEKDHADTHYLITEANWTYDPAKLVSGGAGTTYNAWANVSINSGNGYITSAPLYYRGGSWWLETAELEFYGNPAPLGGVNFTCTPVNGTAPLTSVCTDLSTGAITSYGWQGTGPGTLYWASANASSSSVYLITAGNYSITHSIFNGTASLSMTRADYLIAENTSPTVTTYCVARDIYTGFAIHGAQVDMYDVENTTWSNTTTTDGIGSIVTLPSHHLNLWASATGYSTNDLIGVPAADGGYYSLQLTPSNLTKFNASAGNLTLFVTVEDSELPHNTITGAEVTAAWGSNYASSTTNAAGAVSFTVPNNTAIYLSAFKAGYTSGSLSHVTGSANGGSTKEDVVVYLGTDVVTTATTAPGGGTVTTVATVDPYPCDADHPDNCQRKETEMGNTLVAYGPQLLLFFIMLTFVGGVKLMGKR